MSGASPPDPLAEAAWKAAVAHTVSAAATPLSADGFAIGPLYPAADGVALARAGTGPVGVLARADHPDLDDARALGSIDLGNGAGGLVLTVEGAATARGFGLRIGSAHQLASWLDELEAGRFAFRLEAPPFAGRDLRAGLAQWAARQGAATEVALGLDPIGDIARTGAAPLPWSGMDGPTLAGQLVSEVAAWRDMDGQGSILHADGRPHHDAGASEAEELAAVAATALAYWRALDAAGLDADVARSALAFTLAVDTDLFLSLAKLRALRRLWDAVQVACGTTPGAIRLHAETAWRTQSRRDPYCNLLRGTIASAAAILGGADSLTVLPFTQALGLPDAFARRLARNTALVLLEESGLGRVRDPGAGSGAVEALTEALCGAAWSVLQEIETAGGLPEMLASGAWQRRVAATRRKRRDALEAGRSGLVGVTRFTSDTEMLPAVLMPAATSTPESASLPALPALRDSEPFETRERVA